MFDDGSDIRIGVYVNGGYDYVNLDFSMVNVLLVQFKSEKFIQFYKDISGSEKDYEVLMEDYKDLENQELQDILIIAIPIDISKPVKYETFSEILNPILLLAPSPFTLIRVYTFKFKAHSPTTNGRLGKKYSTGHFPVFPKFTSIDHASDINLLIKLYFERIPERQYLNYTIGYYANSFEHDELFMSFINLCISIEALIEGDSEITYKIARCCAVITGHTLDEAKIVFKNIKDIYAHRSKIVHGSGGNIETIRKHHRYLQMVAAKSILKLLLSDITDKHQLNEILTQTGFGQTDSPFLRDKEYFTKDVLGHNIFVPWKDFVLVDFV